MLARGAACLSLCIRYYVLWQLQTYHAVTTHTITPSPLSYLLCCGLACQQGFWKNWHASYNQWLVRYMYIPMGGSNWKMLNVWPIFTFVALWHDLEWKLLGWGWVMALLMAPELVGAKYQHATYSLFEP